MTAAGSYLDPAEWDRRAAALEAAVVAYWLDTEEELDLEPILAEAAELYRVSLHVAEVIFRGLDTPMRAPTYWDSAMYSLSSEAVDEAGILWADGDYCNGRFVVRNRVWIGGPTGSGCWCWGQLVPNDRCPLHGRWAEAREDRLSA